jgi:hypothetical protein
MIMIVRAIPESLITSIDCDDPALCLLVAQHVQSSCLEVQLARPVHLRYIRSLSWLCRKGWAPLHVVVPVKAQSAQAYWEAYYDRYT